MTDNARSNDSLATLETQARRMHSGRDTERWGRVRPIAPAVTRTGQGEAVARLVPVAPSEEMADARLRDLERRGLLSAAAQPLGDDFWQLPRAEDPHGEILGALLAERAEGR